MRDYLDALRELTDESNAEIEQQLTVVATLSVLASVLIQAGLLTDENLGDAIAAHKEIFRKRWEAKCTLAD